MIWVREHWLVLLLLALYTGVLTHNALIGRRRTRGVTDYYVGGRSMGGIAIGISFFATYASTNSYVGFSGQAYSYGAPWLILIPSAVLLNLVAWLWVAPRLRDFTASLNSVTIPDFIGFRFQSLYARRIAAVIVIVASLFYMTAVFKGIGNLLEVFLGISYVTAIVLVVVIVMAYTAVGGFISVVRTDVVQGIVMIFAALLLFFGITRAAGGIGSLSSVASRPEGAALFAWDAAMPFPLLLGIVMAGTLKFVVDPRQLSRFYALADRKALRRGMWMSTLAFLLVYSLLVPLGLYARNIIPSGVSDTDLITPTLLSRGDVFNPAVSSVLVVAMIAAAMSSLDSVLLVMASTFERDVISLWRGARMEAITIRYTRVYVALFALITALLAFNPPGGIVTLTAFSGSLFAACFFPAIVLGLHWRRGDGTAVMASFAIGIAVLLLWRFVPFGTGVHPVFPALLLSTLVYAAAATYAKPVEAREVAGLFDSVSGKR